MRKLLQTLFLFALLCLVTIESKSTKKAEENSKKTEKKKKSLRPPISDIRLKTNIKEIGKLNNGLRLYKWEWNQVAKEKFNLTGNEWGVIAQEVLEIMPEAVYEEDGFYKIKHDLIFK